MGLDRNAGKRLFEKAMARDITGVTRMPQPTPEDDAKLAASILDNTFEGRVDLGDDPEYTLAAIRKYGLEGLNAACHPEDYPLG